MADSIFDQLDRINEITSAAQAAGVRPELVHALIRQESAGNINAASPKGALGLMQVMPSTAAQPGFGVAPFDPTDPTQNLHGGVQYLKGLLDHFGGDEKKALAAYNGGVGNVESGKAAAFPETQHYVKNVITNAGAPTATGDIFSQLDAVKAAPAARQEPASLSGFIAGVPASASKFGKGIVDAVTSPMQTLNTLGKGVAGAVENLAPSLVAKTRAVGKQIIPDSLRNPNDPSATPKQTANAIGGFYKNRYGGVQNIKDTLYNDPIGSAADVAGLLSGVGGAAKVGGLVKVGGALSRAGEVLDPLQAAIKGTSAIVQGPAERVAQHLTNVNMQIPKALRRRELNSPFTPAEAVLNEGRGTNPFTRLSQGGLNNAEKNGAQLTGQFNDVLASDLPKKYPIDSVDQILADQQANLMHDINGQPKAAQVAGVRSNLQNNPLYSKDKYATVMVPQTTPGSPASTILGPNGQPLRAATLSTTTMVPQQQVVGRELIPQTAQELNVIKGNVDKGLTFGERGGTLEEAQKAARRGIDQIIDTNVPGAKALNDRRSQNVVATKALQDAILARQTKRAGGLAEAALMASPILMGEGHPIAGALAAMPWAYNTIVKHPTLSSPLAAGAHAVGTYSMPAAAQAISKIATPTSRVNEASKRPLTKEELDARYKIYLASLNK